MSLEHQVSLTQQLVERELVLIEREDPFLNPGQVEQVIDEAEQEVDLKVDVRDDVLLGEFLGEHGMSDVVVPRVVALIVVFVIQGHQRLKDAEELVNDGEGRAHLVSDYLHDKLLLLEPLLEHLSLVVDEAGVQPDQVALEALVPDLLSLDFEKEGLVVQVSVHCTGAFLLLFHFFPKVLKVDVVGIFLVPFDFLLL